jgi:hypothetical protein
MQAGRYYPRRSGSTSIRALVQFICALAFLAALVLAAPPTGSATGTPDAQLLQTYQPVLVFHPSEPFRPSKVQSYVDDARLEQFVGTDQAQLPFDSYWQVIDTDPEPGSLPPPTPGVFYRLNQVGCQAGAPLAGEACYAQAAATGSGGPALYARVARTETRIVLQYWLFYYDNPLILPETPVGTFWQSHESDWEVVSVILGADEQPLEAAYSQHCSGQRRPWAAVEKSPAGSTHLVDYVALGSHANFFGPGAGALGEVAISRACIPPVVQAVLPALPFLHVVDQVVDGSDVGALIGPPGSGLPPATLHRIDGTAWSEFGGRWGESEYFFTPIALGPVPAGTSVPLGLGPPSPANQRQWDPNVVLGWPPS